MDTRTINGGVFLGLEGVVIKSHGGTDAVGFARAVEIGYEMASSDLLEPYPRHGRARRTASRAARRRSLQSSSGSRSVTTSIPQLRSVVLGVGSYLPEKTLDQCRARRSIVDTSDEWIVQRTGIKERHIAAQGRDDVDARAKRPRAPRSPTPASTPDDIDLIIVGTSTPD